MEPRSMAFISAACGGELMHGTPEEMLNSFTTDSRQIQPGTLFLALAGERFDGHDFLEQVAEQGAGAVVVNRHKARKLSCAVIAVDDTRKALGNLAARYRADYQVEA